MMPYYPARDGHPCMCTLDDNASAGTVEPSGLGDNLYENNSRTSNQFISPGTKAYPFAECAERKKVRIGDALRVVPAVSQSRAAIHPDDLLVER